jgi:hypothetical protein
MVSCGSETECARVWRLFESNGGVTVELPVTTVAISPVYPSAVLLDVNLAGNPGGLFRPGAAYEIVYYGSGMAPIVGGAKGPGVPRGSTIGAAAKAESDLYITGSFSPAIRSDPQYNYDISLAFPFLDLGRQNAKLGVLGVTGTAKADKRIDIDPDTFSGGGYWQFFPVIKRRGALQGVIGQVSMLYEFGRKNDNGTFVVPFTAQTPVRLWYSKTSRGVLTPLIGFETGSNRVNALISDGSGQVARTLAGADLAFVYKPKRPLLYSMSLSTQWRTRWLGREEIHTFFGTTPEGKVVPRPVMDKARRDRVESKFQWMFGEFIGVTAGHEYGVMPPVYAFVDHKVSIGITIGLSFGTASRLQR